MSIRILAVDDHEILRAGIRVVIDGYEDLELIGEVSDGLAAVEQAAKLKPDIVIMDIGIPGLNGIEATRQITEKNDDIRVLVLSGYADKEFVLDMFKAGARGYVIKDCMSQELIKAIYDVHAGQAYLCSKAADILIESITSGEQEQDSRSSIEQLTDKECQLLKLVAQGFSSKEIAYKLGISIKTVDGRKRDVMKKLVLHGIADLTRFAIKQGLVASDFEK